MATIPVLANVLKNVLMTIGTDDFQAALEQVAFNPSADTNSWTGLAGNTVTDVSTATWVAALTYMQDWDTPNSLSRYLHANEGSTVAAVFRPRSGTGPSFGASLVITPGAIGGAVNSWPTTSVTLGCTAKPTIVEASSVPVLLTATPSGQGAAKAVIVSGARFTGTTGVTVGGTAAASFAVISDSTLLVVLPAGAAGSAPIIVTNASGASTALAYTRAA